MSFYSSDPIIGKYLTEVLDSENEQGKDDMPQKETDSISALGVHSQQRVKKALYEINNRAKEQGVSIERAYFDFMKTATYGGLERNAIKQKLGIGVGGTSVKEERITEVTGFGGKVDPKTGKYDTSVTSPSQKKYREGLPTRSKSLGRGSSQSLTNVPAKNKYDGGVGEPDLATTPARRAELAAKRAERQVDGKRANKIRSTMTRTEHREYILNRAVNKESFGWRSELNELVGNAKKETGKEELIKEMPAGESNKIIINPKLNETQYSFATGEVRRKDGSFGVPISGRKESLRKIRPNPNSVLAGTETPHNKARKRIEELPDGRQKKRQAARVASLSKTYSSGAQELLSRQRKSKLNDGFEIDGETLDALSEYFYNEGLNEYGVEILIENLGVDEFCEFVDEIINEQLLTEWRRGPDDSRVRGNQTSKSGKHISTLKGGAKSASVRATPEHKARKAASGAESSSTSGMKDSLKRQSEIANAKKEQKPTKSTPTQTKEKSKGGILGALRDRAARDTELLKKSWKTAREVGKKHEKTAARVAGTVAGAAVGAAKVAHAAGDRFAKSEAGQKTKTVLAKTTKAAAGAAGAGLGAKKSGKSVAGSAGRAVGTFVRKMREDAEVLDELKLPKDKKGKLPGVDFVTKINSGLRNLADKKLKSKVPYAALSASNEIEGDLIEELSDRQRKGALDQLRRRRKQDTRRYNDQLQSLGVDPETEQLNNSYIHQIKERFNSNLNNSYVSDLEMTEETPDLKQQAMDIVMKRAGGAGNFAKKDPRKKVANTAYYDKTHDGPGSKPNIGESTRSIDSYNNSINRKQPKETSNDTKPGRVGVRLPNSPNKIDYAKGYRVTTKPPKMNVTYIKSGEKK